MPLSLDLWNSAVQASATQGTAAGDLLGADGRHDAPGCYGQLQEFIRDAQDEFNPVGHGKLVVKASHVGVDGMG